MDVQVTAILQDHVFWVVERGSVVQLARVARVVVIDAKTWRVLLAKVGTLLKKLDDPSGDHVTDEDSPAQLSVAHAWAHVGWLRMRTQETQDQEEAARARLQCGGHLAAKKRVLSAKSREDQLQMVRLLPGSGMPLIALLDQPFCL